MLNGQNQNKYGTQSSCWFCFVSCACCGCFQDLFRVRKKTLGQQRPITRAKNRAKHSKTNLHNFSPYRKTTPKIHSVELRRKFHDLLFGDTDSILVYHCQWSAGANSYRRYLVCAWFYAQNQLSKD